MIYFRENSIVKIQMGSARIQWIDANFRHEHD